MQSLVPLHREGRHTQLQLLGKAACLVCLVVRPDRKFWFYRHVMAGACPWVMLLEMKRGSPVWRTVPQLLVQEALSRQVSEGADHRGREAPEIVGTIGFCGMRRSRWGHRRLFPFYLVSTTAVARAPSNVRTLSTTTHVCVYTHRFVYIVLPF